MTETSTVLLPYFIMPESKKPAFPGNELALHRRELAKLLWVKPVRYLLRKPDLVHLEHLNNKQLKLFLQ